MHINYIKLVNFRKFKSFELTLDPKVSILIGNNAQGKSTVLEALYLITNLSSPFSSDLSSLLNYTIDDSYFKIEAELDAGGEKFQLGIVCNDGKKRLLVNGKKSNSKKYSRLTHSAVFSVEQIDQLMHSPSKRRNFMDQFLCSIDYEYEDDLKNFSKVLRHRNARLKKLAKVFYESGKVLSSDKQLAVWTEKFAEYSAKVMKKRLELATDISEQAEEIVLIYNPTVEWSIFGEMIGLDKLIELHLKDLEDSIKRDIARGYTTTGAHRDDWEFSLEYSRNGEQKRITKVKSFGSRGEKRYSIGKLILQFQEVYKERVGFYPILLLDDIYSELDDENMKNLIAPHILAKQQVVLTGIREGNWIKDLGLNKHKIVSL